MNNPPTDWDEIRRRIGDVRAEGAPPAEAVHEDETEDYDVIARRMFEGGDLAAIGKRMFEGGDLAAIGKRMFRR